MESFNKSCRRISVFAFIENAIKVPAGVLMLVASVVLVYLVLSGTATDMVIFTMGKK
jgi:hypothetical protein